jgi:hypothetical protein
MKLPIETIVTQRIKMQSTIKALETNFGVEMSSISYLQSEKFAKKWAAWNDDKRLDFARTIGGNGWGAMKLIENNLPLAV